MPDLTVDEFLGNTRAISRDNAGVQDLTPDEFLATKPGIVDKALGVAKATGKNLAAVGDMILGLPGQALQVGADIGGRVSALARGGSRSDAEWAGKAMAQQVPESLTHPVAKLMKLAGFAGAYDDSDVSAVMDKAMGLLARGGEWVEQKTGGALTKADVESLTNTALFALGAKGTSLATDPVLKRLGEVKAGPVKGQVEFSGEKPQPDVWQRPRAKTEAGTTADMTPDDFLAAKGELPQPDVWRRDRARPAAGDAAEFERQPVGEMADVIPTGDAVELPGEILVGKARELASEGRLANQVRRGVVPAALAATGLGLAAAYGGDKEDLGYAAAAGGALALGRGKGLTLAEIAAHSDAAPLKTFRDQSLTTLNVLENLDANKFKFTYQEIADLLKRPEITDAESGIIREVLETLRTPFKEGAPVNSRADLGRSSNQRYDAGLSRVKGLLNKEKEAGTVDADTITAKELMLGVKKATGDWELKKVESDQFADYGLESVGRVQTGTYADPAAMGMAEVPTTTSIYQLPEGVMSPDGELGGANHFSDPDYFAHTRSFTEDGIKHVVELQSDLAQKAGKVLTEAERAGLEADLATAVEARKLAEKELTHVEKTGEDLSGNSTSVTTAKFDLQRAFVRESELISKLAKSASTERIQPLLKNWYKRLVREELAESARGKVNPEYTAAREELKNKVRELKLWDEPEMDHPGPENLRKQIEADAVKLRAIPRRLPPESVVRFATADTVAKVEGWPEESSYGTPGGYPTRFSPQHQGIYDRYRGDVEKFLRNLGGKPYTDPQGHTWLEVPTSGTAKMPAGSRVQMFGRTDPKLLSAVAIASTAAAATAYLSAPENRTKNAAIGAAVAGLAMFAKSKSPVVAEWAATTLRGVEHIGGVVSTRIGNISKPLLHRMREFERGVMTQTNNTLTTVAPFVERLRKVPKAQLDALNAAILTGRPEQIRALIQQTGDRVLQQEWERVRTLLARTGQALKDTGRLKALVEDYYPRIVTDVPGLLAALGGAERSHLQKLLDAAERRSASRGGAGLSEIERSAIINKYLKSPSSEGGGRPGFLKKRTIAEVTPELAKFYAPASESLPIYLRGVAKELERAKFFGESAVRDAETGVIDTDASIGNVVEAERASGRVSDEQISELRDLLQSRFGPGERSMAGPLQTVRNLTNAGLLGHVTSALTQAGDIAIAAAAYGILPSIKALQTIATNKPGRTSVHDIGLVNHITEELATGTRKPVIVAGRELSTAKFLEKVFKYSGFSLVDQLGKNVALNASLSQAKKLVQTEPGIAKLRAKYGEAFGPEFNQLVTDLRRGEMTEPIRTMLFSELSDIQPISKLEVPKAYLDNPNGRIMYMLRTFMIKQADIIRREVVQEFRRGNIRAGTEKALRYGLALGISGATTGFVTNWLLGRNDKLEWGDLPANMLRTFGWSQFVIDKMRKGEPLAAAGGTLLPPYQMWQQIMTQDPKAVQYLPVIGKLVFNHGLGGADKYNEQLAKREATAAREASMTDFDRRERDRRREERKREKALH
jgi:hypothetical protein